MITPREREVLVLVARGMSNSEIAEALHMSAATAKTHVESSPEQAGGTRSGPAGPLIAYESGSRLTRLSSGKSCLPGAAAPRQTLQRRRSDAGSGRRSGRRHPGDLAPESAPSMAGIFPEERDGVRTHEGGTCWTPSSRVAWWIDGGPGARENAPTSASKTDGFCRHRVDRGRRSNSGSMRATGSCAWLRGCPHALRRTTCSGILLRRHRRRSDGVTTVIGGNCGFSITLRSRVGPKTGTSFCLEMLSRVEAMSPETLRTKGFPWDWTTTEEYFDRLDHNISVNAGFMVGHSAIRRAVMGATAKPCALPIPTRSTQ